MKKIFKLSSAAMLALSLAACSSDDAVENNGNGKFTQGEGFIGVNILMPTEGTGTRANDDLNNGKEDEFEVKNATILFFHGDDEANAVYYKSEIIGEQWSEDFENDKSGEFEDPSNTEGKEKTRITSTSTKAVKIDDMSKMPTDKIFAYVVVNVNESKLNTIAEGTKFSEFSKNVLASTPAVLGGNLKGEIGEGGLLMTNAPVSASAGGNVASQGVVYTAVEIHKDKIMKTEAEAKSNPAACIYVERASAKVTVENAIDDTKSNIDMNGQTVAFEVVGWQIINTEPQFYNTRQSEPTEWLGYFSEHHDKTTYPNTLYRFVARDYFVPTLPDDNHTLAYRTYFGKDLQYDKNATLENTVAVDAAANWLAVTDAKTHMPRAFVPENTFDVQRQISQNTTQVALKVKFNGGKDFYTISNDAALYGSETDVNNAITAKVQTIYKVDKWVKDAAQELADAKSVSVTGAVAAAVNTSETGKDDLGYTISVTFTGASYDDLTDETKSAWKAIKAEAETAYTVALYKGGMSFYNVRIKHFGDFETPWSAAFVNKAYETTPGINSTDYIYDNNEANYLGRYSVVRNNWYDIKLASIKKLGSAEPKDVKADPTPDDQVEEDQYISVHVHILPWVLRTQNVEI